MKKIKVFFITPLKITLAILAIFLLSFFLTFTVKSTTVMSKIDKTIVIDAGHGGIDAGTNHGNILEKDINLAIAKKLENFFTGRGNINVIMTRDTDELYQKDRNKDIVHRVKVVKESKADLLVSIHVNSFPGSQSFGGQTFYKANSEESKKLADFIQKKLIEIQPENYRKIKEGPYYVLRKSPVPAVIVEVGFISNSKDRKRISNSKEQDKIAQAIGEGIIDYFNNNLSSALAEENNPNMTINSKNQINLYYGTYNQKGIEDLAREEIQLNSLKVSKSTGRSKVEEVATKIIDSLLAGPQIKEHLRLIPQSTKLLNLEIKDNIAYVNFNKDLISINSGGDGELLKINSIIYSLTQLPEINQVQVLIEGKSFNNGDLYFDTPLN
jgi:N-acetylmuramoyl-L-alanine amidase